MLKKMPGMISRVFNARKAADEISAPVLSRAERFPYGAFRFEITIESGLDYEIHASPDLVNWSMITAETAKESTVEYLDSHAHAFNARFYRVLTNGKRSANVLGYASTTAPPGFSMIANPFSGPLDSVEDIFKGWTDGTSVSRFDTTLFKMCENTLQHGKWSHPTERLTPGEGAIFFNPTNDYKSLNFVGEVAEGSWTEPIPAGFSMRSSKIPRFGHLQENLGFPVSNGDVIHVFDRDRQQYVLYPYANGAWTSGAPIISLCESFWVAKAQPFNWQQALTVPN